MKKKRNADASDLGNLAKYLEDSGLSDSVDILTEDVISYVNLRVKEMVKEKHNKKRIQDNDALKQSSPANELLTASEIDNLPKWVRNQLENAQIIGNSGDVILLPDGSKYHRKNRLNDLPGNKWTFFLNSVINTRFPTSGDESYAHHIRKIHPSPKPPQLMRDIIEFFTKENELVFDYFMGVGGSLLGASLANRRAVGIDLNQDYINAYLNASKELGLPPQKTLIGDSIDILADKSKLQIILEGEYCSLILIDPPYGDMLAREKTGESAKNRRDKSATPFTDLETDLGNMSVEEFFPIFRNSVSNSIEFLKPKGHVVVFMKDLQPNKDSSNLLHARVIEDLSSIPGLNYVGMKIWADQGVNLYPYGYPYSFVSNQIHQFILIFKKD
jgi:16S rRNA G966 N2-methylase RsmD